MANFKVGILGGMGPLAGVELHRLIIEATPAKVDQDHLQVLLFTNPSIPDRTASLRDDNGEAFAKAAGESAKLLSDAGVDLSAIACMTAHSRIKAIQAKSTAPIINGIKLVHQNLAEQHPDKRVALLATQGSINSGIYTSTESTIDWLIPNRGIQSLISDAIYQIKGGHLNAGKLLMISAMRQLKEDGAGVFVLGCTELGLLHDELVKHDFRVVDPLRVMAKHIVKLAKAKNVDTETILSYTSEDITKDSSRS